MEDIIIDVRKKLLTSDGKKDLQFTAKITAGEISALFGSSGEGKTTVLRMLAGLTRPDSGIIMYGKEIWFDSGAGINRPPQARNAGLMFQDYALFPNMTVEQNIRYAQRNKDTQAVDLLLDLFGLSGLRKQYPVRLSGGQKQRVALARAIAHEPGILLLDEPFSAVDYRMRQSLRTEIKKAYQLRYTTMVIVSHDPHDILDLASEVFVLEGGKIACSGAPASVLKGFRQHV